MPTKQTKVSIEAELNASDVSSGSPFNCRKWPGMPSL
jgi:hypothetical protein